MVSGGVRARLSASQDFKMKGGSMDDRESTGPTAADRLNMDEEVWSDLVMSVNGYVDEWNTLKDELVTAAVQRQAGAHGSQSALLRELEEVSGAIDENISPGMIVLLC